MIGRHGEGLSGACDTLGRIGCNVSVTSNHRKYIADTIPLQGAVHFQLRRHQESSAAAPHQVQNQDCVFPVLAGGHGGPTGQHSAAGHCREDRHQARGADRRRLQGQVLQPLRLCATARIEGGKKAIFCAAPTNQLQLIADVQDLQLIYSHSVLHNHATVARNFNAAVAKSAEDFGAADRLGT